MVCEESLHFCRHCEQQTTCLSQAFANKSKQIACLCYYARLRSQMERKTPQKFLGVGYPDETLAFVTDILRQNSIQFDISKK